MVSAWSTLEVEATVADYFAMLDEELHGRSYNKTVHRRQLLELLDNRSEPAIERKHQNISAILIELGFPYISGYKPLGNYQGLLKEVVSDRLSSDRDFEVRVKEHVSADADVPDVEDILNVMVDPPAAPEKPMNRVEDRSNVRRNVDYLQVESSNRSLGGAGEEFVVRFEIARLVFSGMDRLADKVERVSETIGDGLGFDVLSYDEDGTERLIEVKTTAYGPLTPFYVTRKELAVSVERREQYHLYRAYGFRKRPRLFSKHGALEDSFDLQPFQYKANIQ